MKHREIRTSQSKDRMANRLRYSTKRWLSQLCRRERRGPPSWFRTKGQGQGRYSWCSFQGRQGLWCRSVCFVEGEEGEAKIVEEWFTRNENCVLTRRLVFFWARKVHLWVSSTFHGRCYTDYRQTICI